MKTTRYILTLIAALLFTTLNTWGAITPTQPSGSGTQASPYQIGTAAELWWFAQNAAANANAKLTADINLGGSTNGSFPNFGSSSKKYTGTFDGQGHTISGYYWAVSASTNGQGFFNYTNTGAVIKDFKLEGDILFNNASYKPAFVGAIVGSATSTTIQDVTSFVNITTTNNSNGTDGSGVRIVGGIVGSATSCTINRCRYKGTMSLDASTAELGDRFAGIAGDVRGNGTTTTIKNCLFDGTITCAKTSIAIGGILGKTETGTAKIENSLSVGTLSLVACKNNNANHGMVLGNKTQNPTITDTYYTTANVTISGTGTLNSYGTLTDGSNWSTITDNLNGGSSVTDCNWKVVSGQDWPIPMAWTKTQYTITFKDHDGTTLDTKYVEQGGTLSLPSDPTRTGYTFTGWSPEVVLQPTGDATYTAQYSINQYNVNYYVDNVLTYTDSYDYGAAVTAHAAPTKDRYTFSGWSEIPSTMPANDVRVDGTFTYTANTSGVYEIGNREDYVNFVAITKTNAAASAKLIADIDLNNEAVDCIGTSSASYTGTFDGQGYTISNYYRSTTSGSYSGLFAHVTNATIRKFKINGNVTIGGTGQQHGSVIGTSAGATLVEDVWSSVNVSISSTATQVGGFVGRAGGTYNRCRYNGTVSTATAYDKIGGFASNLRDGHLNNCLFDGTLSLSVNNANLKAGGLVGAVIEAASTIEGCLSHGTITIANPTANCGIAIGFADKNITVSKLYYTTTNAGTLPGIGTVTATLTGSAKDVTSWSWNDVNEGLNPSTGSVGHWQILAEQVYPVPGYCEHTHVHTWGDDGYCKFDGARQPIEEVDGYYLIANKGQFWAFYEIAQTNSSKNAKLTADIDLDEEPFNGFTGYTGTFDGQKHTISGYKRTFTSGNSSLGFFNSTSGATIKDFTLDGEEIYNINSACYAIGSVIGMANSTTIEGVTSKVKMTFGANCPSGTGGIRVVGGLVGRISGGSINKCRYNGTIDLSANSGISDRFGGIVGDLGSASTISNCLFDGEIKVAATSSLSMGGILGTRNSQTPTIQRCLFNGKMTFPAGANISNCGPVSGGTGVTASDSYYDMTGFTVGGTTQAKTAVQQSSSIERTTQPWIDILVLLNAGSSNWGIQTENYPVPGDQAAATYTITFNSNGGSDVAQISLPAGAAITAPENPTWEGHTFTGWNPALPATMPSNDLAVTAQWRLTKYAVNYYVDDILTYTDSVEYSTTITAHTEPTKERYTFSGWRGFPDGNIMPANDVRIDGTFTFTANALGVFEIGNQEDLFNFAAYVNATGLGTGSGHGSANAKLLNDIVLDGTTPFPGIGKYVTYQEDGNNVFDPSYAYTGTFDGQGYKITGYVRNVTGGNYGGMFNYTNNATIKNFSLAGTMSIAGTGQQYGSVVGCSAGTTLVEDVYSSVNVTISSTASQVGGFVGRAGGTYNRCRYDGTVSSETAYDKIGGFAGNITAGTLTNCLFDGTITLSAENEALKTSAFVASSFGNNPHVIQNCLVNGTMTISHPNDNCGIVVGYYEQALTVDHTYYTGTGNAVTGARGTLTGRATPKGDLTWVQVLAALNPTEGTDGNWEIKTTTGSPTYPIPSQCTIEEHVHEYINGFCIAGDAYEEATKAGDGYYEIDNAGKLWWVATKINDGTLAKNTRIRLTAEINMEGDSHGQFPGICPLGRKADNTDDWEGTAFQGIFHGENHTINNFSSTINAGLTRRGLFNAVYNATINQVNINGSLTVSGNGAEAVMIGAVIGSAAGTSHIEDINSSVNITVNNGIVRNLGGVAGALEDKTGKARVTMNRCRYNGTITVKGTQNKAAQNIGGVVGELRSAVMKNCLYDGTITVGSNVAYESIGGVVGKVGTTDNSEMHRILCHGVVTLPAEYAEATNKCGIVVGSAEKTIYLYKCYHTTNKGGNGNVTSNLPYIGPHVITKTATASDEGAVVGSTIEVDQLLGTSTDKSEELADLFSATFRTLMGESNWHEADETTGNAYIYPYKDEAHIHKYSNGFCTAGDGEYEKPSVMGKDYKIYNGGQLFWFATEFNAGNIPQDATVEIMRDIDMEGNNYIYPGIGSQARPFKGVFNGHDHTIGRYYRDIVNAEHTGLINYAVGAEIKYFSIYGEVNFNLASVKSFHGTVLGMGINGDTQVNPNDTMLITDVFSFVNINCSNANVRVLGGIAGRTSGGVKRSRYSGTIKGMENTASASGRQIAGIVANAREKILISDCLFSGEIWVTCQEADTMRVSGILASNEKNSGVRITIKNCLFNGCLKLQHTYVQGTHGTNAKSTENGVIAGYWDSNLPKFVENVYYLKTCDGMEGINIGNWEGKNQQTGSSVVTHEIEGTKNPETGEYEITNDQWNEIFKELDEYEEVKDEEGNQVLDENGDPIVNRNGNWLYEVGEDAEGHPVPGGHICQHLDEEGNELYDEFGYCTICGAARPLQKDEDGKYKMELVSDLASFRDMVNDGDIKEGTILNAKLTADIDFAEFEGDFGEPIGNSNFNRYLYNFDGQGHKLLNVKITTDDENVGFFGFAGDDTHDCEIHDLTITGTIEVPYKSTDNDDKPMYMGVVGKMYRGKVYNVHSELTMRNTNPTRAMIGGIVGCCETSEGNENGQPLAVIIDKCSYTGTCYINAAGNFGGILGQASRYTEVKNCTFAGNVHHTYKGVNNSTNFSGIVGYNGEPTFKGVKNCVVAGVLNTDPDRQYVKYGEVGNHKNAVVGEDAVLTSMLDENYQPKEQSALTQEQLAYRNQYANNYAWEVYRRLVATNSSNIQIYVPQEKFINGEICAIMNGHDDNASNIQDGHPWGQVLGYQKGSGKNGLGINDDGNIEPGAHTDGSPAQRVPIPGWFADSVKNEDGTYTVVKRVYKVVATTNTSDNSKKDYIADWYYFDDQGDATPYPSDAASMKVKKIEYHREANYLTGYNSFCLPFDFTQDMRDAIDANAKIYTYSGVDGNKVNMTEVTSVSAGEPFILLANSYDAWEYITSLENENNVSLTVNRNSSDEYGLYGSLNTILTGAWTTDNRLYKIKDDGRTLVRTTATSHCYPYRAYIKLPAPSSGATERDYELNYGDEPTGLDQTVANGDNSDQTEEVYYNVLGIRVTKDATGVILVGRNKKIMIVK